MANKYAFFRGCFIPVRLPHIEHIARKVLPNLNIGLVDVKGFTCCPEPIGFSIHDKLTWLTIAARNISLAEDQGLDILTLCNGCYYTLTHTLKELKEKELKDKVNEALSETGHEFKGKAKVKHFIQVLNEDVGVRRFKQAVKSPLDGLNVATHTGCHFTNPENILKFDDKYISTIRWFGVGANTVVLDSMVSLLGANVVDYKLKNLCCGWMLMSYGSPEAAYAWLKNRFDSMKDAGADCSTVICPQCFYQFDIGQSIVSRKVNIEFKMPVMFYLQLLGLAMGYSLEEMQNDSHRVRDPTFEEKMKTR